MKGLLIKSIALASTSMMAASLSPAHAQCIAPATINGIWKANDGGTYRLRAVGTTIWWVGMSADNGKSWTHAFKGTRSGNLINGSWADVRGNIGGAGTLKLQISGTTFMKKLSGTGSGFGGSSWSRPCNDVQGNPVQE
ncbi:MAG: hypothetical protein IIZ38_11635 [Sphingomonas sp.]|uniref:hypothetical protein n=1 Tax=unclassified Sphingomonas TaxID=196159 RepID=UPI002456D85D|nr:MULTISPECIES: hypothetical protein [unclassified Sphingomonas]MBQ1498955.1 hypothetical protein [Sphingomonas sp.]MDH4746187.1 hypothetical protein [Sphingomonas sp. CBMAI 2297]